MLLTVREKLNEILNGAKVPTPSVEPVPAVRETTANEIKSFASGGGLYSTTGPIAIVSKPFNGEKNPGELGTPVNLLMDHVALRARAYEAQGTSDLVRIVTGKFFKWTVGNGLQLQSEPRKKILDREGVVEDLTEFTSNVEDYFPAWAESNRSSYSGEENLHTLASQHEETKFLGGDDLTICRIDDDYNLTVQVIDGQHVISPILNAQYIQEAASRGNIIIKGVELNAKRQHVAYYVRKQVMDANASTSYAYSNETVRIAAYGEITGLRMAWLGTGTKHRIDHIRGIPAIYCILEKISKLDRYTEATVATAEERAKIVYTVVHGKASDGRNPLIDGPRTLVGNSVTPDSVAEGATVAQNISVTEEKQVYNMPIDSELKAVSSQSEIQYEPFFKAVFIQLCAAVDIPPEVALQQYNSNYSASRAAINGWGFIIGIYREKLVKDFYKPIYELWLYIHILKGKVSADRYLEAKKKRNFYITEAYSAAKFTGVNMPHIDPVKELTAIRLAMGANGAAIPLISNEQATAMAQGGDWATNIAKLAEELNSQDLITIMDAFKDDEADATSSKDPKQDD